MDKIYCIQNTINGKCYVGYTSKEIQTRFQAHINASRLTKPTKSILHAAMKKYGTENFECFVLYEGNDALQKEDLFISVVGDYNLAKGGNMPPSWKGKNHTDETKEKIRMSHSGKKRRYITNENKKGFKHSPESIEKMRNKKIGKPVSPEAKEKISKANTGRVRSPEVRRKISETKKQNYMMRNVE